MEDSMISLDTPCMAAEKITIENPAWNHTFAAKAANMEVLLLPSRLSGFALLVTPRILKKLLSKPIIGLYISDHNKPSATIDIICGKNSIVLETPDNI